MVGGRQRFMTGGRQRFFLLAAGAIGAAFAGALLFSAGEAEAQPITIPGLGTIDVPFEIPVPAPFPEPVLTDPAGVPSEQLPTPFEALPFELPSPTIVPGAPQPERLAIAPERTTGETALDAAFTKLGAEYNTGGTGPNSFDCSGLVQWSYEQAGRDDVPRTSYEQLAAGTPVGLDDLQPGDMVSFYGGEHSALYAGDGNVIHAATYGEGVRLAPVDSMPVTGARRY